MFGVIILPVHFGRGLFCSSSFNFFYIDDIYTDESLIFPKYLSVL